MALTITTDLTPITTAESITGWSNYGSGGAGASALEPDFYAQGSNCISRGVSGAATNKGMCYDNTTGLNFTTTHAGKLVYIWMRCNTPTLADTRANGGIRIVLGSGTTAPGDAAGVWSAWYVDGSDTIAGTDGWKCYVIDPTLPPSTTFGGGVDLTAIRWFGGVMRATTTAKGQNFGVDQISYGLGELRCRGTNTTEGAGFKEMSDIDFGTLANRYGIMVEKEGVFLIQGKLVIGDGISTNSTDFTSYNETLIWERKTYAISTTEYACVRDFNPQTGLPYMGMDFRGNGTGNTNITFGAKVGTGDSAGGRSGSTFIGPRGYAAFDFDDGNVENVLVYGSTFRRIRGGIDMSANASTDEFIGNTIIGCGSFQAGPVEVRGCSFIENIGGASKRFEDWLDNSVSTRATLLEWTNVTNGIGTDMTLGTGVEYLSLADPGASDRRNVIQVRDRDSASLTVTVAAAGGTYTRSAGSYITDGFEVGNVVTWSGFTNAGNNATKTILTLSATVMTVNNTGLVNETGNGDERVIRSDGVGSDDHYAEAVVRWPSAGANQGAWGVTIRGAAATTENYWYLKADLMNNQISLIRCDAGTDTTIVGPQSYTFAEDTDYLIHLIGIGTVIEGFVNGTKMRAVSSTYQTNRRCGIRGDAEADQTGDSPRLYKFACGPITNKLGAIVESSATDDFGYTKFINNTRALGLATDGYYSSVNNDFSGNIIDVRNDGSGNATIEVTGTGGVPVISKTEQVDDGYVAINTSVSISITGLTEGTYGVMIGSGGAYDGQTILSGYANSSGTISGTFSGATPQNVVVRARNSGIINAAIMEDNGTSYTDYTNDARDFTGSNDVNLLPASIATNDAFYFGGLYKFGQIRIYVSTAGTTYTLTWEYYNGAWTSLTVTDPSNSFKNSIGLYDILFTKPSDWSTTSVNGQGPYYYVRARVTSGTGTQPKAEHINLYKTTKYVPYTINATITGSGLTIPASWQADSNADI